MTESASDPNGVQDNGLLGRELWRWVVGYEGLYMVSDHGTVMSVPSHQCRGGKRNYYKPGMVVNHHDNGKGYRVLSLYKDGIQHQTTVHRLVAQAFLDNPQNLPEVNHLDGNKANNNVENLEWVSESDNVRHAIDVLDAFAFARTLTEEQVLDIRSDTRTERAIAKDYGLSQTAVNKIRAGETYKKFAGKTLRVGKARQRKLTQEQIVDIRTSKLSGVELSKKYGVSRSTICRIKKGLRYKEVKV